MSTGFLYPGQGSQTSKMLEDVPASYFHRLEQATGFDLHPVSGDLKQDTVSIQLALLVKAAFYTDQMKASGVQPQLVAGHSIGAFSAALACESLSF